MIAGTLCLLDETVDEPIEDYHDSGFRAIDVDASHEYLDGHRIQSGMVAGRVKTQVERVHLDGSEIDVERDETRQKVACEWMADVEDDGWILAERTFSSDEDYLPDWPFSVFQRTLGVEVFPMEFSPDEFVRRQEDAGRSVQVEMTTTGSEHSDDVKIDWGKGATNERATRSNVGFAGRIEWDGLFIRLVIYESGYTAVWSEDSEPVVGRFIHEEILPIAEPVQEDEPETEQEELA